MRSALVLLLPALAATACGGSSPAAPQPLAATIVAAGNLAKSCDPVVPSLNCTFQFDVRNAGPGCVNPVDLTGEIWIGSQNDTSAVHAQWSLRLAEEFAGVFKPNDVRTAAGAGLPNQAGSFSIKVTHQTNVACP